MFLLFFLLWLLLSDGRMLVHTLDTPLAEGIEDSSFQQRLERMEAAQWNKRGPGC